MRFSVVIPTYNRCGLLKQTLASVWGQACSDYEVIVVDDGSTDGTAEYLDSLGDRIQFLHQSNKGSGAARNLGAQAARGDYLAFLDSDDLWFPWTLGAFSQLICQHCSPSILAARLVDFVLETELATVKSEPVRAEAFDDYLAASQKGFFVGAGMSVLQRDEFLKTGGFTERRINAEDHDLILRMAKSPGFIQVLRPVTLGWRRHLGSATKDLRRSYEGCRFLLEQELFGNYPGGGGCARARREIISTHVRPVALDCLNEGLKNEAWELYRTTFGWHSSLGRWRFLAGFPIKAVLSIA